MSGALTSLEGKRKWSAASCQRTGPWVSAVVALSVVSIAHAGTGVWTSGGPYGGNVNVLAIDPANPATLYAVMEGGVFKSTNSGGTWTAADTGLTEVEVRVVAVDPTNPATLYAGTYGAGTNRGVFKSTDSGGTWAATGTGLPNRAVWALAIDPTSPATVYAGTLIGGIFKTTNSGGSWAAASTGLPASSTINTLAIDPMTPATLYAGTGGGGVFRSTNSGGTWTAANTGLTSAYVNALAIDPATPSTLYAALETGVYRSTNSGGTWVAVNTGLTDRKVRALAVNPTTPTTLYAGTIEGGGVFKSTNSGGTWTAVNTGLTTLNVGVLAIDPTMPATLYVGTWAGVFRSGNSGGTWATASTGLTGLGVGALAVDPAAPATLYAGTWWAGVFRSADSGETWAAASAGLPSFSVSALVIDPATPSTLYAGIAHGGFGVFKSTDSGDTWGAVNTGLTDPTVEALAIDPTTPATLYAGTGWCRVFRSTNAGATWADASTGLPADSLYPVYALVVDPTTPATLFAGTYGGGIFKSTNSGGTWVAANASLTDLYVLDVAIDPVNASTLYAATASKLFKSTDGGGTWADTGLWGAQALVVNPTIPTTLYAGTGARGVLKSVDSGGSWTAVNNGLSNLDVGTLALDPTGVATVYAGVYYGSVWQSTPPTPVQSDLTLILSDSPDPVTGTTPFTYTLAVSNRGGSTATSLSLSQTLPAGVTFDSASGPGWTCSQTGGTVTCTRPSLAVGTAPDITVRATPGPAAAVLVSSATVSAAEADPDTPNNSDSETTTVNEALVWPATRTKTVVADAGEFAVNGDVTYTITLTNAGAATQADNSGHELIDSLPSSLSLVSAEATSGTASIDPPSNAVAWDGSLPTGGSVTVTVHATIGPLVAVGTAVTNQATMHYDADGDGTNEATVLTDDPGVSGANDPTGFVVVSPATDLYTLEPCRLIDTRGATGTYGGPALVAGADRVFPLFGRCGIPPTARAVSVNLTVTQATAPGNLRLYPARMLLPPTSSLNYSLGQTRANNAVVPLNGLGELAVRCSQASGTAHLVLDVNGYFE